MENSTDMGDAFCMPSIRRQFYEFVLGVGAHTHTHSPPCSRCTDKCLWSEQSQSISPIESSSPDSAGERWGGSSRSSSGSGPSGEASNHTFASRSSCPLPLRTNQRRRRTSSGCRDRLRPSGHRAKCGAASDDMLRCSVTTQLPPLYQSIRGVVLFCL